ncbi:type I-U CRISPR-associated RAMP protein Csb1/Cas7u [uncultured Paludibaculum sp.]|uniref:type I-G CRISPR-associated RAMP protein Csb1/Cas7g n=1 Tax=uncultured Paludibaculum sp. TaxID=1765020 RepID=UPI002AAAA1E7|nr:type I-U CRISPR-associated RAMP protein Csb1/Cas7u [uncultured Paludibaculum sp.]
MAQTKTIEELLLDAEATCLVAQAHLKPVGDLHRFQPAGFPEIGQVAYKVGDDRICIVDSAASMANHLEAVCFEDGGGTTLHKDLSGLAYVACVTEEAGEEQIVCTTLSEGHRLASDYFVGRTVKVGEELFREILQRKMRLRKLSENKFFFYPEGWGRIYRTVFEYDPNSLVHGLMFAKESIKISRLLTAHHEAHKSERVSSAGVKFDKLGKTESGQPIFSVTQQTAEETRVTFIVDLSLLRSYGRGEDGLSLAQKQLLLELALWKIQRLTEKPFRYRSGCHLEKAGELEWKLDGQAIEAIPFDIRAAIRGAGFLEERSPTQVHYPASDLYRTEDEKGRDKSPESDGTTDDEN